MRHRLPRFAASLASSLILASGCGVACEGREDAYEGSDIVYTTVTADEVLDAAEQPISFRTSWPSHATSFPRTNDLPLPFGHGQFTGTIEIVALEERFTSGYQYNRTDGCLADEDPQLKGRLIIRTSDGVLDEEVDATLHAAFPGSRIDDPGVYVYAVIGSPRGTIADLLRTSEGPASLSVFVQTDHQVRLTLNFNGSSFSLLDVDERWFEQE